MDFDFTLIVSALMAGGIYALVALGYSLIYKASGLMTFMQGEVFMLGAFIGYTFFSLLRLPFFVSLLFTMAFMFLFGVVVERFVIRVIINKGIHKIYVVLSTIGISIILQNAAMLIWGSEVFRLPQIGNVQFFKVFGVNVDPASIIAVATSILCMVFLTLFINKTRFGTAMRASAQDRTAAASVGINVSLTIGITWGISCLMGGTAGLLMSPRIGISASMGTTIGLRCFAAAIIGGYGEIYGAIIGAFLIGILETFVAGYLASIYKDLIVFGILIVVLAVKPRGIFNANVYDT